MKTAQLPAFQAKPLCISRICEGAPRFMASELSHVRKRRTYVVAAEVKIEDRTVIESDEIGSV